MPRTHWLLAAAVVLPLLLPSSAVSYPPGLTATEISSAKVCGASECRELSDPEAATALAVGPTPRGTAAPVRGLPWYKSTLTLPADGGGEVDRVSVSVTVVPSAGVAAQAGQKTSSTRATDSVSSPTLGSVLAGRGVSPAVSFA